MTKSWKSQRGLTMVELLVVVGIGLIIMGMAIGGAGAMVKNSRADSGLVELAAAVRGARELSISNRRNMQVTFGTNTVTVTRIEYCPSVCTPAPGGNYASYSGCTSTCAASTTMLRTVTLDGLNQFQLLGLPDTPDALGIPTDGSGAQVATTNGTVMFTTDGSFINASGDVINGMLFMGVAGDRLSARAVSIFGPTGSLHLWKWNGRAWVES
jgi:prepilin-type N-terminal cleavage/methylation domain-containing protein